MTRGGRSPRTRDWRTLRERRFARLGRRRKSIEQPAAVPLEAGVRMTMPMARRHQVSVDGRLIALTPAETELVATLLMLRPRPLTSRQLIDLIHADDPEGGPLHKIVDVRVSHLRRKGVPVVNRLGIGFLL